MNTLTIYIFISVHLEQVQLRLITKSNRQW